MTETIGTLIILAALIFVMVQILHAMTH